MASLFDKLKKSVTPEPEPPAAGTVVDAEAEITGDAAEANDALLADLKRDGDAAGVNPPAKTDDAVETTRIAAEAAGEDVPDGPPPTKGVEACPYCSKKFKQLSRHKCPEKPPEVDTDPEMTKALGMLENAIDEVVAERGAMIVCFDCMLRKGPARQGAVRELTDWIKPLEQHVAKENEVEHWSLMSYAEGGAMLAAKFDRYLQTHPVNGYLHVDSYSAVGKALKDVLIQHATIVLQGTR